MPDIAMCMNRTCERCEKCYRFTAEPNSIQQWYSFFKPNEIGECEHFINNKDYVQSKKRGFDR